MKETNGAQRGCGSVRENRRRDVTPEPQPSLAEEVAASVVQAFSVRSLAHTARPPSQCNVTGIDGESETPTATDVVSACAHARKPRGR